MKFTRILRALTLCLIFTGICAVTVMAGSDTAAPLVKSVEFDKTQYEYGDLINVTLDIEETGTGVSAIYIDVMRRKSDTQADGYTFAENFDSTKYSGKYTFSFIGDANTEKPLPQGSYYIDRIQIDDGAGNKRQYLGDDAGVDEEGRQFIRCSSSEDICYTPVGTEFTVGDLSLDDVKVESFRFDTDNVDKGGKISVSLRMSGGVAGEEYMAYMRLEKGNTLFETKRVRFQYKDEATFRYTLPEDIGFGKCNIYSFEIRRASSDRYSYKTYSYVNTEDGPALAHSKDDVCRIEGNGYFTVNSTSPDDKLPELVSVDLSPATLTKPGFVTGKLTFNVPYTSIRQIDVHLICKGTEATAFAEPLHPDAEGRFLIPLGSAAPAGDYYVGNVGVWDKTGNYWQWNGYSFYVNEGYNVPNLDENGRQYFSGMNENDEYVDLYPEFTGAKYVTAVDEFDVAFHSSLSDPQLVTKIGSLNDGETGRIDINGDFTARTEMFEAIAGRDVSIMFAYENYQWIFNGKDITAPKDIDLHVDFRHADGEDYTSDGDALIISFPENGELPGKAKIRIKSDYTYRMLRLHNGLYLYVFNDETGNLDPEREADITAYLDNTDSWCSFDITHNAKFLAVASELKETTLPLPRSSTFKSGKFTYKVIAGRQLELTKVNSKKSLKTVTIPDTVTYEGATYKVSRIRSSSFSKCRKLSKVTIGRNINSIGKQAFYSCPKLKTITIRSTLLKKSAVGSKAFGKIYSKATVKVPKKMLKSYKSILKAKGLSGKKQKVKSF